MVIEEALAKSLIAQALAAREFSYSPYSHFAVGAALLASDGTVFTGCNIENAGFTPTICAERTAFFKAVSQGVRKFDCIAIVGGKAGEKPSVFAPPCGVCRQVMREFCSPKDFQIILAVDESHYKVFTLEELLPMSFGPEDL